MKENHRRKCYLQIESLGFPSKRCSQSVIRGRLQLQASYVSSITTSTGDYSLKWQN